MSRYQNKKNEVNYLYQTDKDFVHKLLKHQFVIDINTTDNNKNNLLHNMIANNDLTGIDLLLDNLKSNVYNSEGFQENFLNAQNNEKNTPMHIAVMNGLQDVAKRLDSMGANKTLTNNNGYMVKLSESESNNLRTDSVNRMSLSSVSSDTATADVSNLFVNLTNKASGLSPRTPKKGLSETQASDNVSTNEFLEFIKNKMNTNKKRIQDGGKKLSDASSETGISGVRRIQNNNTMSDNSNHSDSYISSNTASDTLGISNMLDQLGGDLSSESESSENLVQDGGKARKARRAKSSRSVKPSSEIHTEVIKIIQDMTDSKGNKFSEDDARYIKAGLYQMVKDKYPNLGNMQRALKLKEVASDEAEVQKMAVHLPKLKELVTKAREQKMNQKQSVSKESKEKKEPKAKAAKASKEPKAAKEPKAKKSKK